MFEVKENACLSVTERLLYNICEQLKKEQGSTKTKKPALVKNPEADKSLKAKEIERKASNGKSNKGK